MFEAVCALQGNQVVQALRNLFHVMHERDIGVSQSPAALDPIDLRTSLHALDHEKVWLRCAQLYSSFWFSCMHM